MSLYVCFLWGILPSPILSFLRFGLCTYLFMISHAFPRAYVAIYPFLPFLVLAFCVRIDSLFFGESARILHIVPYFCLAGIVSPSLPIPLTPTSSPPLTFRYQLTFTPFLCMCSASTGVPYIFRCGGRNKAMDVPFDVLFLPLLSASRPHRQ
jgi:hypothetical protein